MALPKKKHETEIPLVDYLPKFRNLTKKVRDIKAHSVSLLKEIDDPNYKQGLENFRQFLETTPKILLSTHEYPDADGLGSQIALYYGLKKLGIPVEIANPEAAPQKYEFLDPNNIVTSEPANHDWHNLDQCGLVLLDTNNFARTKKIYESTFDSLGRIFILDHHTCDASMISNNFICSKSSSTGELIYITLLYLGIELDQIIAKAIYTSILSDTGSFRYPNTNAITHKIIAQTMAFQLNPRELYANIFQNFRPGRVPLMGPALQSLELLANNHLAVIYLKKSDMDFYGVQNEDTDNIVNVPLMFHGILASLFLREEPDGLIKVSMRSQGDIDVAAIAKVFQGGGHKNAAGTKFDQKDDIKKIKKLLIEAIQNSEILTK